MKVLALPAVVISVALAATGCARFTTSDAELANLKAVADVRADEYIGCMKTEASSVSSTTEYAFVAEAVRPLCKSSMEMYQAAQKEYLSGQVVMTGKPLGVSVKELEQRAEKEVAELLASRDVSPQPEPAAGNSQLTLPSAAVAAASAAAMDVVVQWNPEQRVYLDCMDEQADKYLRLNESAEAIASVAANRCKSYLTVERRAVLEEAGKVQVMGKIMDQRLSPR